MEHTLYDVVISGAGPSGAAAARGLSNAGLRVLVIEKNRLPRYKMCSGIIFKKSQDLTEKYFGKIPDTAYVKPRLLSGVRLWSDLERFADWPFNKNGDGAPNIWRSEYDNWLITHSGAEIIDGCLVKGFNDFGNHVAVECYHTAYKKTMMFTCKYLIGAEGSKSVIRENLAPEFEEGVKWFVAYQNYYEGASDLDPNFYHGFLELQYGEVYAWFNVKDNLHIFGTAVKLGGKLRPYLATYQKMLESRFGLKTGRLMRRAGCMGNDMCSKGRFCLGKGNILLVGESAGFLNAFGEGISCALSSGLFAAEAISTGIKSGEDALTLYTGLTRVERRQTQLSWKLGSKIAGRDLMPL